MSDRFWKLWPDGIELAVRATPKGGRDAIDGARADAAGNIWLAVRVSVPADGGKANKAVARLLASHFDVPGRDVALVSGATARLKHFRITGDPAKLEAAARSFIQEE